MNGEAPSGQPDSMPAGLTPGAIVAGYRVQSRVGAGGMAVVYRAHDEGLGRTVALKILAPGLTDDTQFRERFIRESRAVAAVDHPHIIPVYAAGEADGVLYLAMRYVPGGDLRAVIAREGPLTGDRVIALLSPIASALDSAHADGLIHRDVKPANILVHARDGRPDYPFLSDFGLVKGATATAGLTGTGQLLGTPNYVAPEQISGQPARPQTDQYGLACVAYTMLTGALPFARDDYMAVLWAHMYDVPPSLADQRPDLPPAVDEVLARALAKSPDDRYGSCEELIGALRTAVGASPPEAAATVPPALHAETVIILPSSTASAEFEAPAEVEASVGEPDSDAERTRAEGIDLTIPPAPIAARIPMPDRAATPQQAPAPASTPEPEPAPVTGVEAVTMTVLRPGTASPDSGQTAPVAAVSHQAYFNAPAQPTSPEPPSRRLRALIIAMLAAIVVVAAVGVLLVHPWIHPPVLKPTGLAVAASGPGATNSVEINWSGPATGPLPDTYEILRNDAQIATVPGTATSYADDGLTPSTSYRYQVIAVRGGKQSPASATLGAQTSPLQPTGLAVKGTTTSSLVIAWSGPSDGPSPDQYEVLRNGAKIATVPGSATSYTDRNLAPDTAYGYQVIAVTGGKQSRASAASAHTASPPLSTAVLDWSGQVTENVLSVNPAEPGWDFHPGSTVRNIWTISPDCSSGPCDATLAGAVDNSTFTAHLTRSGTTYTGTAPVKAFDYCDVKTDLVTATISLSITVKTADTQGMRWTANSFSGSETVYVPVYTLPDYSCYASTAQFDVKS